MLSLRPHHITDLFVLIDDIISDPPKPYGGRPSILSNSEVITILVWNALTAQQKTLKTIHRFTLIYLRNEFPKLPLYNTFINHCQRVLPQLLVVLEQLLSRNAPIRFMDSTMLEVCKLVRADAHKVVKNIAKFGKNHQG